MGSTSSSPRGPLAPQGFGLHGGEALETHRLPLFYSAGNCSVAHTLQLIYVDIIVEWSSQARH